MRLFIAAELPVGIVEALAETSALVRGRVRGRFVAPDSFHVTLAFLGDVSTARIDQAVEALDAACVGFSPFEVSLGELGSFGRRTKATLWQGFHAAGALPDLAKTVRTELDLQAIAFDDKPFLPHVTLMRAADLSTGVLPAPALAAGPIETITLFSSDLSGDRPIYDPVHRTFLA